MKTLGTKRKKPDRLGSHASVRRAFSAEYFATLEFAALKSNESFAKSTIHRTIDPDNPRRPSLFPPIDVVFNQLRDGDNGGHAMDLTRPLSSSAQRSSKKSESKEIDDLRREVILLRASLLEAQERNNAARGSVTRLREFRGSSLDLVAEIDGDGRFL